MASKKSLPATPPAHATGHLRISSPVGELELFATEAGIAGLYFDGRINFDGWSCPDSESDKPNRILANAAKALDKYFGGATDTLTNLPTDAAGTEFQRSVWQQLSQIPFGKTRSYGEIATLLKKPGAMRAVGLANGSNPISIIVPCHRVIGTDGSLTGFGGGLKIKRQLLELEGSLSPTLL